MSNNSYYVEFAKSGRSKCKKCKEPILKDALRIVTEVSGDSFDTTVSCHPACFALPRKFSQGATKITAEQFVEDVLQDKTGGDILPAQAAELAAAIESKAPQPNKRKSVGGDGDNEESLVAALKKAYEARTTATKSTKGDTKEPPTKKAKSDTTTTTATATAVAGVEPSSDERAVDLYGEYHKVKNDQLKDILRWNRQILTGTKDALLYKVIDGALHGRLARCKLCGGGRLKIQDGHVICGGAFDEASNRRIDCAYTASPDAAPRWHPWFTQEPSEQENEEMDRLDAEAKGDEPAAVAGAADSDDVAQLKHAASQLEWTLTSRDGLRAAATNMVRLLLEHPGKKVDIPADQAQQKVGQLIAVNKDKTAADLIPLVVSQFGFVQDKQMKAEQKQAAIETIVKNSANAPLVAAFQELAELYFKAGNANAGASYKKVVSALSQLDFAVTEDNAKGLGKGKTKVANIGKASADKMYEFVTTGTIEKLQEKRSEAS